MGRPHSTRTRSPVRFASMATDSPRLAIVGSGFSGLCLGIRLKQLGIDSFTIFEKTDHLGGKRVAVIGNAASAIQFIPQIAPRVAHLTIFQRSANWMLPRGDRAYRAWEKWLCGHVPGVARLYRWWIWANLEMRFPLFRGSRMLAKVVRRLAERNIQDTIADPRLREVLLPD